MIYTYHWDNESFARISIYAVSVETWKCAWLWIEAYYRYMLQVTRSENL